MSNPFKIENSTYMKPKPEIDAEFEMLKGYNPMYDSRLQVNGTTDTDNVLLNSVNPGAWNDNKITYESLKGQLLKDVKKAEEEDVSSDSIVKKLKKKVMTFELMEP